MNQEDMKEIRVKHGIKKITPIKSIKFYCKEMCCAGDQKSWKECVFTDCFLFPYRMGRNPFYKGKGHSADFMRNLRGKLQRNLPKNANLNEDETNKLVQMQVS